MLSNKQKITVMLQEKSEIDFHQIALEKFCIQLNTHPEKGISNLLAAERNSLQGDNQLPEREREPRIIRFLRQLTNWFAIMLWIGSGLCIFIYLLQPLGNEANLYLSIVLIFVILITGIITFLQAEQSEAMMQKFKQMLPLTVKIIREGKMQLIPAKNLVRGDLIEISNGDKIPADVRIIESNGLKVDNSALTGEAQLLSRGIEATNKNPLESNNMAFFGTLCKNGRGKGIVTHIGENTFLGKIANLSSDKIKDKTPLRIQLDRFVLIITIIACSLGFFFILIGKLIVGYSILQCIVFGIGIIVANVPEGILACVTISLAITASKLAQKNVLVKNLESVETLGSTSCICTDKTGTLTMNKMTVNGIWISKQHFQVGKSIDQYLKLQQSYNLLLDTAVLSSEADIFQNQQKENSESVQIIGDASQISLLKFIDHQRNVSKIKNILYEFGLTNQQKKCLVPFNSVNKYSFSIARKKNSMKNFSNYCIFLKGAPQKIFEKCTKIMIDGKEQFITSEIKKQFIKANLRYGQNGQRVLGFAIKQLPQNPYHQNYKFNINEGLVNNFQFDSFVFIGLISLIDPPKPYVGTAIQKCRSAGIKVIMITGDQSVTAVSIAQKIGIITYKSNLDYEKIGYTSKQALDKALAIAIHGNLIDEAFANGRENGQLTLEGWVRKPEVVFSRTTPIHKLEIVKACRRLGHIVGVTGDGVNDAPAIKQANIGISMGISGSDVTKDAADMILLTDDFASIVDGIEEGRKIFDNLKKTIVYLLTSNITEILPFIALVLLQIPLPLSNIFMLCICVGTDIYPAISLAYEEPELDIMTRTPRKIDEHLTSIRMMVHAYGLMGSIATAGGFFTYFLIMELYGFSPNILFNIMSQPTIVPTNLWGEPDLTFNLPYTYDSSAKNLGNDRIPLNCQNAQRSLDFPNWLGVLNNRYDLRGAYNVCCLVPNEQYYCSIFDWPTDVLNTYSQFSSNYVKYTTESLAYAQSGYFFTIVLVQWCNLFACKSRKTSFIYSAYNKHVIIGIIFETILALTLLYIPGVNSVFGGRPLNIWLLGIPGLTFAMLLLTWEEGRKYLINIKIQNLKSNWFEVNIAW